MEPVTILQIVAFSLATIAITALAWGALLKNITIAGGIAAVVATAALIVTAKMDERECLDIFGPAYAAYMKRSKIFIPFLF